VKPELVAVNGVYDFRLLGISALLAILMQYAAFEVVERARATLGLTRRGWILVGGTAVGIGLSAAPDCGIFALRLPVPVRYHYPTLLLSLLLASSAVSAESLPRSESTKASFRPLPRVALSA